MNVATKADERMGGGERALGLQARLLVALMVLVALVALFWPRGDGTFEAPGGFLLDANGRPTTLGNHMTPVVLLHFWATWCPPCITEIPALDRLADELTGRGGFQIVMVAVDDTVEKAAPFVGQRAYAVLYDPNWDVAHRYGTRKLPETYLIVNGQVVEKFIGAQNWDDPALRAKITAAIDSVQGGTPAG